MNSIIETLNQFGAQLLHFAWPMLWQSSLLIAFVFALDFLLARKIRASVRYALWLAVLVKLLLPPTLALPTGATWWLVHAPPAVKTPTIKNYTITYDTTPLTDYIPPTVALPPPPPPRLTGAGWALLASGAVSAGLLLWLVFRWWQVTRMVRRAIISEEFADLVETVQQQTGLRSRIRLKLIEGRMSPAVCGLFRPVILLPRMLAEQLSPAQLCAVLLHEAFHLRRKDVWVNCAQALLQIVYWWHPLLWIANARIRRLREEAVDDAVMLALRDEAETYAPTLLEVAKLALRRPLASLGLVGIMESRSALRQRIERLVDFRAPRKAGLTFASVCMIFVFSAVALPMGEAPSVSGENSSKASVPLAALPAATRTNAPQLLIQAEIYRMRQVDFEKLISDPAFVATRQDEVENFRQFARILKSSGFQPIQRPRILTSSGVPAQLYVGNETNSIELECSPLVTNGLIDLATRITMITTTENVATTNLTTQHTSFENGGGHVFSIRTVEDAGGNNIAVVTIRTDIVTNKSQFQQRLVTMIQRSPASNGPTVEPVGGILADTNFRSVVHVLEQRNGVESLAEPEVTTTSGRGINRISTSNISAPEAKMDAGNLVQDAKLLYEMGKLDEAELKLKAALALDPENTAAKYYLGLVQTNNPAPAIFLATESRREILKKLNAIRLGQVRFDAVPLGEVLHWLSEEARQHDLEHKGLNFMIAPSPSDETNEVAALPITIHPAMTNLTLGDALDAVLLAAPKPIKYSIQDYAVVFSARETTAQLFTRVFRVDANSFVAALRKSTGMKTNGVSDMARNYFHKLGVDWESPKGKSVFYSDSRGLLYVKATESDLDTIEKALSVLNTMPLQIHIKTRFLEVPKGTALDFEKLLNVVNAAAGQFTGILNDTNARIVLRSLESRQGVEVLGEPEMLTTSGRQTQMRVMQTITVITNFMFQEFETNQDGTIVSNSITPQTSQVETGPILDVVPYVLSDGYTINLSLIPSFTEFLGYDQPTNSTTVYTRAGEKVDVPKVLPRFSVRQVVTTLNLYDNQTAIIGGFPEKKFVNGKEASDKSKASNKELLVLVTATIVDPAGNRVHSDDELPFAQKGVPPQPEPAK